jgi:hypothetical protein
MNLPVYQFLNLNASNIDDLEGLIKPDLNIRTPLVINLLELSPDLQRETIGLIENTFVSQNSSFLYPYPVYLLTVHEPSITQMAVVNKMEELPKFFNHKESRLNVKEGHILSKNRLLQQEIRNTDPHQNREELEKYAEFHRRLFAGDQERRFLRELLTRLLNGVKVG